MYLRLDSTWSASRSWSWSWITLIFARGRDTCPLLARLPLRYFQLSQAKLEVKSAFDFAEILDSLFADFISQNSNKLAVSRSRCNFRLYWSSLLPCLQLFSRSAMQGISVWKQQQQHLDTASNHAFACKFASHRWRNMPGICMQIYLRDATRLKSCIGSGTAIGLRSYIAPCLHTSGRADLSISII